MSKFWSALQHWDDQPGVPWRILGFPALLGAVLLIQATYWGPGVGGDATIYISSAKNLLTGNGLGWIEADGTFRFLPYTPPFYPLLLALLGLFGIDLTAGARWMNVFFFSALIFGCTLFLYRLTGKTWLSCLLGLLIAFSPVILGVEVWAMSEGLFLILAFAGLGLIFFYLTSDQKQLLVWAAVLAGMAFLTRYMGAAVIGAGGLALLLLSQNPSRRRWVDAAWFGVVSLLPMVVWGVISLIYTGTISSRSPQPIGVMGSRFLEMGQPLLEIYLFWLFPGSVIDRLPGVLRAAAVLLPTVGFIFVGILLWRKTRNNEASELIRRAWLLVVLLVLFILSYLLVLTVVQVFTYPPVTLASRMLSPVHLAALLLLPALAYLVMHFWAQVRWASWVVVAGLLIFTGSYLLRGALVVRDYTRDGVGYTGRAWQQSTLIHEVRKIPAEIPLVSNDVTALYYLTGRRAYPLHEIYAQKPRERFTVYGEDPDDPGQVVFHQQGAALVLFASIREDFAFYGDRLDERLAALTKDLYLYYPSDEGWIYFYQVPSFSADCPDCKR